MKTIETTWREFGRFPLQLGRMAENDVLRIAVDVSSCLRLYPAATFGVNVENAAGVKYPAENVTLDNGLVLWTIAAADTAAAGDGKAQVVMYGEDGEIDRSAQAQTVVLPSILPDANPPDVPPNWPDVANRLQGQIDKLAESVGGGSAEVTAESITNALGYTPAKPSKYAQPDWGAETGAGVLYDGELMIADAEQSAEELIWSIPKIPLEAGKTYTVTWMGTQYECIARSIVVDGLTYVLLGNAWIIDGVETDEPFAIIGITSVDAENTIVIGIRWMDAVDSVPMTIEEKGTIHKIPAVYVGGIGAFPAEDVGKLLYIGEDGMAHALALGDGLSIVDGVLHVDGVESTGQTFYTADGNVFYTIDDALFKVKGEE